jgi:uncharacterized membrane protein YkoI
MTTRKTFGRNKRVASAGVVVLGIALSMGGWMLFGDPAPSSAHPDTGMVSGDASTAASNLEVLHQRAMARINDEDENDAKASAVAHPITPEQAATVARAFARVNGKDAGQHYIELKTHAGRPAYEVRIGGAPIFIDAETGSVVP